jgi:dTMP kinase
MKTKKAKFITIEGTEGSGKSSVINFLKNFLEAQGFSVIVFREPGTTKIGEKIRHILLDKESSELSAHTELLLYLAARAQLIEEKLKAAFKEFDFVICDRFYDSTLVYQGIGLGLGKIVFDAVKKFSLGVNPDLTILLDADPRVGLNRIEKKDRIESRPLVFHEKLRRGFLSLAKKYPKRVKVVDAGGSLAEIYPRVEKTVCRKFKI